MYSSAESASEEDIDTSQQRQLALDLQNDRYTDAANTAISSLRINFIILGLYIPIISFVDQGKIDIVNIFTAFSTQVGLLMWMAASFSSINTYYYAKKRQWEIVNILTSEEGLANSEEYKSASDDYFSGINGGKSISRNVTLTLCLSLGAVIALSYGVIHPFTQFTGMDLVGLLFLVFIVWTYSLGIFEVFLGLMSFLYNPRSHIQEWFDGLEESGRQYWHRVNDYIENHGSESSSDATDEESRLTYSEEED